MRYLYDEALGPGAPSGVGSTMSHTLEISDDLKRRIEPHLEEDETIEEFVEELVNMYESEGRFLQEGYSE